MIMKWLREREAGLDRLVRERLDGLHGDDLGKLARAVRLPRRSKVPVNELRRRLYDEKRKPIRKHLGITFRQRHGEGIVVGATLFGAVVGGLSLYLFLVSTPPLPIVHTLQQYEPSIEFVLGDYPYAALNEKEHLQALLTVLFRLSGDGDAESAKLLAALKEPPPSLIEWRDATDRFTAANLDDFNLDDLGNATVSKAWLGALKFAADDARESFIVRAQELNPHDYDADVILAIMRLRAGDTDGAEAALEPLAETWSRNSRTAVLFNALMGHIKSNRHEWDAAEAYYSQAITSAEQATDIDLRADACLLRCELVQMYMDSSYHRDRDHEQLKQHLDDAWIYARDLTVPNLLRGRVLGTWARLSRTDDEASNPYYSLDETINYAERAIKSYGGLSDKGRADQHANLGHAYRFRAREGIVIDATQATLASSVLDATQAINHCKTARIIRRRINEHDAALDAWFNEAAAYYYQARGNAKLGRTEEAEVSIRATKSILLDVEKEAKQRIRGDIVNAIANLRAALQSLIDGG